MKGYRWTDGRRAMHGWSGERKKDDRDERGLTVNEADGWTVNRGEVRKTRRSQNSETKSEIHRE